MLRVADFRDVAEPGEYYVRVPGLGRSPTFRIGEDVYVEPFRAAMLGMHGQRCGSAVSFTWQDSTFSHGECHTEDEAPFGWHDAGDFGKYTNNGALSLGVMLLAWEHFQARIEAIELDIPERGGSIPDFLDECRHQVSSGCSPCRTTTAAFPIVRARRASNPSRPCRRTVSSLALSRR
jgi:endoglucanase